MKTDTGTVIPFRRILLSSGASLYLLFLFVFILLFFPTISHSETEPSRAEKEDSNKIIDSASQSLERGEADVAIRQLKEFISTSPSDPSMDRVLLILGKAYFKNKEIVQATLIFQQIINEFYSSPIIGDARYNLALVYMDQGELEPALAILEQELLRTPDPVKRLDLTLLIGEILLKKKKQLMAIERIIKERDGLKDEERGLFDARIISFIDKGFNESGLRDIRRLFPNRFPGDFVSIRLIETYNTRNEPFRLENEARRFVSNFPRHDYRAKAEELIAANKRKIKSHKFIVGVILQMEGKLGYFSQRIINGINLALEDEDNKKDMDLIGLVIKDLEEDSSRILQELDDMINEYKPIAIVGPLMSKDLEQTAPKAERAKIPMITPSATASILPKRGKYAFRNALTNRVQSIALAEYAVTKLGLKRFAIIYPDDSYGRDLIKAFYETILRLGGEVIDVESYPPDANDFGPQIKRLKDADLKKYGKLVKPDVPAVKGKQEMEYYPGFDAIFLPGDYDKVGLLAPQLAFYDIQGLVLLGTNGWNSEELIKIGGRFVEGGIFIDGFFMDSPDPLVKKFTDRYRTRFNENPDIFSAQAYDVMMMIIEGIRSGVITGNAIRDYLSKIKDFQGVSGLTTFRPDGDAEKKPFLIQIRDGRFVQIN